MKNISTPNASLISDEDVVLELHKALQPEDRQSQELKEQLLKRVSFRLQASSRRAELLKTAYRVSSLQESLLRESSPEGTLFKCTICGFYGKFLPFGEKKRPNAQCPVCHSFERTRFMVATLERLRYLDLKNLSVLELAPTKGLHDFFRYKLSVNYLGIDINPGLLISKGMKVQYCDLCDGEFSRLEKFDVILNSHVMEHIVCDPIDVIRQLHDILKPGGIQLISVPFAGNKTISDTNPSLSAQMRLQRFGHPDHVRAFGHQDFPDALSLLFGSNFLEFTVDDIPKSEDFSLAVLTDANMNGNRLFGILAD